MQLKFTLNRIILFLLLIFPSSTIYQGLPGLDPLNRLLSMCMMALMTLSFFLEKMHILDVVDIMIGIVLAAICLFYTDDPITTATITTFIFWFIFFCYLSNNYEALMKEMVNHIELLKWTTLFWEISVFISLFLPSSYVYAWDGMYFMSFSSGLHRFAMTCFTVMAFVFILLQLTNKKIYLLLFIIPVVGLLLSGTRTYLMIGLVFLMAVYYIRCEDKKIFFVSIIPLTLIGIIGILMSPSGAKFINAFEGDGYFGYWATLTNGRSMFWLEDIQAYFSLPFWKKLVGNGINFVYEVNLNGRGGALIWAHNDVINLLLTNGLFGVFLYFKVFFAYILRNRVKGQKWAFVPAFSFYFILGFNAMFNMLYTYVAAVVGVPFLLFGLYTLPNDMKNYTSHSM